MTARRDINPCHPGDRIRLRLGGRGMVVSRLEANGVRRAWTEDGAPQQAVLRAEEIERLEINT